MSKDERDPLPGAKPAARASVDPERSAETDSAETPINCIGRFASALVVDDDEQLRRSLARRVRSLKAEVFEATSVAEALELLERGPALVVTDVRLPDGNGRSVAEAASRVLPTPLIVAMSGLASASEAFALAQAGARVYLTKPFAHRELLEGIASAVAADDERAACKDPSAASGIDGAMLAQSLDRFAARHKVPEREMALVRLAVAGVPRGRCPALLGVSDNTCKTMTRRLLQRCGARNLDEIPRILLLREGGGTPS